MPKVWDEDEGTTPFVTVTGPPTWTPAPEQVPLAKYSYKTDPPGLNPPDIVAESVALPPAVIEDEERVVVMEGLALFTVRGSQGLVAALLFESPL